MCLIRGSFCIVWFQDLAFIAFLGFYLPFSNDMCLIRFLFRLVLGLGLYWLSWLLFAIFIHKFTYLFSYLPPWLWQVVRSYPLWVWTRALLYWMTLNFDLILNPHRPNRPSPFPGHGHSHLLLALCRETETKNAEWTIFFISCTLFICYLFILLRYLPVSNVELAEKKLVQRHITSNIYQGRIFLHHCKTFNSINLSKIITCKYYKQHLQSDKNGLKVNNYG